MNCRIILMGLSVLFLLGSCTNSKDPCCVSKEFLTAFYKYDIDRALKYADSTSVDNLNNIKNNLEGVDVSSLQQTLLEMLECREYGDTAVCRYILKQDIDDAVAIPEKITLVKRDGKWKVIY